MNTRLDVSVFMRAGGQNVHTKNAGFYPGRLEQANLYTNLVKEEYAELMTAVENQDILETADACADLIWVVEGLMYSLGIDPQTVWDEIARSNHSKTVDGQLIKRDDGKVLKPDTYKPPNIQQALGL